MNLNQVQALLETLPDEQIMQYAQGSNPQVPQILAQMEAMRRSDLRKSKTLQAPGMNSGGIVRKFAEGGVVGLETPEERAKRRLEERRGLRETGGWANQAPLPPLQPTPATGIGALTPAAPPTPMPQPPKPQQMPVQPQSGGVASLAPAQPQKSVAPPAATSNPSATPEVLAKVSQAADEQASKFADQYRSIFAERAELRESGRSNKPNPDADRQQAFYYALAKFGATLATTGIWAQAGDVGLEAFRSELEKSKGKQDEFRKESLQIGLTALDDKLAALGIDEKERQRMRDEAQKALENRRADRNLDLKQEEIRNTAAFQKGQLRIQGKLAEAKTAGGTSAGLGSLKASDINTATARVDALLEGDPKYRMLRFEKPAEADAMRARMVNQQVEALRRGLGGEAPFGTQGSADQQSGVIDFNSLK
jgi:hypothetical protein